MEERNDIQSDNNNNNNKIDEVMLPGFRFHPTDEELVGFYLKKKIQHRPLSIELIKQLDIYKYDPWDLPKLATIGEKEWYFFCPRDRKYRNSSRPNRVTGAGFWKATGTDRPIYNSEGSKCIIGLKKSLVFYKGRAAKGIKTDWMMHEFRLPSSTITDSSSVVSSKRYIEKNIPANDAWAICRIFKKNNSTSQRSLSHSRVSPIFETPLNMLPQHVQTTSDDQLSSDYYMSSLLPTKTNTTIQYLNTMNLEKSSFASFSTHLDLDLPSYKSIYQMDNEQPFQLSISNSDLITTNCIFGDYGKATNQHVGYENCGSFSLMNIPQDMQGQIGCNGETTLVKEDKNVVNLEDQLGNMGSVGFSYGLPLCLSDAWKANLLWDSSPCPSEISTNYSTN